MIGFAIAAFFFVQMIVSNIIPIAVAIVLVIVLPIYAKAHFEKKTGRPYDAKKGGE